MSKLLNRSLRKLMIYATLVLVASIPVYYFIMSRLWQYELDEHNVVLTREADREDAYIIITTVTSLTVLFFILMMTGFLLLNKRISRKLWQPFYNSLGKIRTFDLNKQNKPEFETTDIDEFSELNHNLEKLIGSSITAYNQQKEFADNASHELQTPLAIIQSRLELLMQTSPLSDDQYALIEDATKALTRATRINKNLLLLTKIENSQFMEKETINLSDLLQHTLQSFSFFAEDKKIIFQKEIQSNVMVEGNKTLVEILLNNLLTNAIRYSETGAIITITCKDHLLRISNPGSSPLKQEQLFKRFAGSAPDKPGTGLGLALVHQVTQRNNWSVSYTFEHGLHVFNLLF